MPVCLKRIFVVFLVLIFSQTTVYSEPQQVKHRQTKPKPLILGLLPYLSARTLIKKWRPFVEYLEYKLNRPIKAVTAANFATFIARTKNQEYDILFTAPHFAALAERQKKYERLVRFNKALRGDLIVNKKSTIRKVSDLKNKMVVTPDPLAIITLIGEKFLQDNKFVLNKNISIRHLKSHNTALYAVAVQQADVAIVAGGLINKTPLSLRKNLRLLTTTDEVPHTMLMLRSTLSNTDKKNIRHAIKDFTQNKRFSDPLYFNIGFGQFTEISDSDMNVFKTIIPVIEKLLKQKKHNNKVN